MSRSNLHLFTLPPELLETLTPRTLLSHERAPSPEVPEEPAEVGHTYSGARSCNICLGVTFANVDDQRSHFRSDWHRYNVKAKLSNGKAVAEAEFASLLEGLTDLTTGHGSANFFVIKASKIHSLAPNHPQMEMRRTLRIQMRYKHFCRKRA